MKTLRLLIFIISVFSIFILSCNKKNKLTENSDPNAINFILTQPSISQASFIAKCTNYDIILDTVNFLTPDNLIYKQYFNSSFFYKNEEFSVGNYDASDGLWIIQFKGTVQGTNNSFAVSVPYDMNIVDDEE